jgi:hypothetical protein
MKAIERGRTGGMDLMGYEVLRLLIMPILALKVGI